LGFLQVAVYPAGIAKDRSRRTPDTAGEGIVVWQDLQRLPGEFCGQASCLAHSCRMGSRSRHRPAHDLDLAGRFERRDKALGGFERRLDPIRVAGEAQRPRPLNGQPRMGLRVSLDGFDPLRQRVHLAPHDELAAMLLHQLRRAIVVARQQGLLNGLGDELVLLKPLRGTAVKLGAQLGELLLQGPAEHVGKQVVIAIPMPLIVQRDEE
jgi:hypothetical protein